MPAPRQSLAAIIMLANCTTLVGCTGFAGLQDWHYNMVNRSRAQTSWYDSTDSQQRRSLGPDFKAGYEQGFFDMATGKDCQVAPVPPPKYWSAKYQCAEGQEAIQDWFRGYQVGMTAAEKEGYPSFHEIPVSPQAPVVNKTACGTCYSPDSCPHGGSQSGACSCNSPVSHEVHPSSLVLSGSSATTLSQVTHANRSVQATLHSSQKIDPPGVIGSIDTRLLQVEPIQRATATVSERQQRK